MSEILNERRYDTGEISATKKANGFLEATVRLTKAGVYPYLLSDGSIRLEAKLPETIFSKVVIDSANGIPVTDGHPSLNDNEGLVTPQNYKRLVKGTISNATRDGKYLTAKEIVFDQELINELESGEKLEVSIGFTTNVEIESGEIDGKRYDAIQKDILINHLAHVKRGNAGPDVKVLLDSGIRFGIMQNKKNKRSDSMDENNPNQKTPDPDMGLIQKIYTMLEGLMSKFSSGENSTPSPKTEVAPVTTTNVVDTVQITSLQAELAVYKNKVADLESKLGEYSGAKMDQAIDEKIKLISTAKSVIPDFKFDSLSNRQIKLAVIGELSPNIVKQDVSDLELNAVYTTLLKLSTEGSFRGDKAVSTVTKADEDYILELKNKRLNMKEDK